ncbi:CRISPR-associated helicase Cas3' [Acetobacterium tundrae]|uniref:CRISPR-associated helicase Cas3 n=1 Tax=Acetobacterium tundrae TaxID=132932 RepID=A0ABR6WP85_9FIRM|nr:CRISPR-associated helicase Cas3' [Acetobacterium tundrae]MBC3798260.1 CRISPR-associated helicase Cas3' [Acetobacterium tundrae]
MIFDHIPLFDFNHYFDTSKPFYAHLKTNEDTLNYETLEAHLGLTLDYLEKLWEAKKLDNVFENFERSLVDNLSASAILLWRELFYNAIYTHDLGKTNPNFQVQKMSNENHEKTMSNNSNHSFFSALIYCNHYLEKIMNFDGEDQERLFFSLVFNSFIISKHHGYLGGFQDFLSKLSSELFSSENEHCVYYRELFGQIPQSNTDIGDYFEVVLQDLKNKALWKSISWIIYGRFLYGLLVSCDFYATSDFMNKPVENFGVIDDIKKYRAAFNSTPIYETIQHYQQSKFEKCDDPFIGNEINRLRCELFLEAEEGLTHNSEELIFFLEAPTGSGKTNTSINLALKLLEADSRLSKITYVFPFNTLVEQTRESLEAAFNYDRSILEGITVVNGVTAIKKVKANSDLAEGEWDINDNKDRVDYEQSLLGRQFLHYPLILTTHVNFFNTLFGTNREEVFPLAHLANSVIILDEIQSYRNDLWKEIILFLQDYAKLLNMRIIIMSATLPDLGKLSLETTPRIPSLIKDSSVFYQHPLFKNRVNLDFSLLDYDKESVLEKLLEKIIATSLELANNPEYSGFKNKLLVEFIFKTTTLEFFELLQKTMNERGMDRQVLCITGDDNKAERKRIIDKIKSGENLILVATQVIEAGVDIDMDMGFKDVSLFDAEEQFLGRINRSCKKKGSKVFFFNYNNADRLYPNDFRKQEKLTIKNEEMQKILIAKDFSTYYDVVLSEINTAKEANNEANIEKFARETLWNFDYPEIQKHMQLIDENNREVSVFIYQVLEDFDGNMIDGYELWSDYKTLLEVTTLNYAEKRVRLSEFSEKMSYFIYQIPKFQFEHEGQIGELFLCRRDDSFFPNGKFDRKAFEKVKSDKLFL